MSKQSVTKGATSQIHYVWIRDSSSSVGAGLTGLAFNSGSLVASYVRPAGSRTAITLATQTVTGAYSSGGFVEVDATNMPGLYRLDVPDAVFATGVNSAIVMLKGATNMEPVLIEYELKGVDLQDAVRGGMTALANAAAGASGGLLISGSNAGTTTFAALTVTGATTLTGNVALADGLTVSAPSTANRAGVSITGNGTGAGLSVTSGNGATGDAILATAASTNGRGINALGVGTGPGLRVVGGATGAGLAAVGGSTSGDGFNASATSGHGGTFAGAGTTKHGINATGGATTSAGMALTGGSTSGDGLLIATVSGHGMNIAATGSNKHGALLTGGTGGTSDGASFVAGTGGVDLRANQTGNITGNLSGSAGSVTGAVGSVTGAVGSVTGNVGGSVASVTGAVGSVTGNVGGSVASVTGAVASVTGAVGSVTGNVGGNVTGSVGSVASGGISEASFATTAGSFAPLGVLDQGTAQAATSTTLQLRSAAAFGDNTLVGCVALAFGSTQGYWQAREIIAYVGSTDTATVDAWSVTPSGTVTYRIIGGSPASSTGIDLIFDEQVDGTVTFRQSIRLQNSAAAGKASGMGTTTATLRDLADTKDRIVATVDTSGNRSAVTRDVS